MKNVRAYIVLFAASLMHTYDYALRVLPSTMIKDLAFNFGVGIESIAFLASLYFYGYFIMQVPSGLLFDYIGPRLVLTAGTAITGICTIVFSMTHNILLGDVMRFITGFVSATGFIGALVIASNWFKPERFAMISGFVQFLASLGAIAGLTPLAILKQSIGWQNTVFYTGIVGLFISAIIFLIVRDHPKSKTSLSISNHHHVDWVKVMKNAKYILAQGQTWAIALVAFCTWGPIVIFATLWGDPFLIAHYHLSNLEAAGDISIVWIAIAISSPLAGYFSNFFASRKIPLYVCFIIGLGASLAILLPHQLSHAGLSIFLVLYGIAASSQVITFGLVRDTNSPGRIGTAVGFNNMAVIMAGVMIQPLIGVALTYLGVNVSDLTSIHSEHVFNMVLLVIPAISLLGLLATAVFIDETHCMHLAD